MIKKTTLAFVLFITVGTATFFTLKKPSDLKISQSLESLFVQIENFELTAYRKQDWCKVLEYKGLAFANTQKPTCTFLAKFPTKDFTPSEKQTLNDISKILSKAEIPIRSVERILYSNGKIRYIEFHEDCSCRTRYIYDPGYTLTSDEPHNLWHFSINKDWYRVEEDWN